MNHAATRPPRVVEVHPIRRETPLPRHIARPNRAFWLTAALTCAAWNLPALGLAPEQTRGTTTGLVTALAVFYGLVPVMALALATVALVPLILLAPPALLFRLVTKRRSGLVHLAPDLFRPAARILPGYVHALRGVRSPTVWGLVAGSTLAAPMLLLTATPPS